MPNRRLDDNAPASGTEDDIDDIDELQTDDGAPSSKHRPHHPIQSTSARISRRDSHSKKSVPRSSKHDGHNKISGRISKKDKKRKKKEKKAILERLSKLKHAPTAGDVPQASKENPLTYKAPASHGPSRSPSAVRSDLSDAPVHDIPSSPSRPTAVRNDPPHDLPSPQRDPIPDVNDLFTSPAHVRIAASDSFHLPPLDEPTAQSEKPLISPQAATKPEVIHSVVSDLLQPHTSPSESSDAAVSVLNRVLMSLRSSFNIDPETLYSQWANTHPGPAEPERGLAASPEAEASSSLAEWWPNKLELDRIVRSPVAIKRDILRTRLSDRAILAGLVIPATHFPWQGMRYTLFQQGYQMLNIPDEVPFPGQETAQTAYRGLNGLPVDICTPWIRSLPSDASKGVIFHKLNVADAKLLHSGLKPVFVSAPPHPRSPHTHAKQLYITETRMWQARDGPPRRLDADEAIIGVYHSASKSDAKMDALMMRDGGAKKGVSHQFGVSDEVKALVQKAKPRSKPTVDKPFIVSDGSADDDEEKEETDEASYKDSSEGDRASPRPSRSTYSASRRVMSPLQPSRHSSRLAKTNKPRSTQSSKQSHRQKHRQDENTFLRARQPKSDSASDENFDGDEEDGEDVDDVEDDEDGEQEGQDSASTIRPRQSGWTHSASLRGKLPLQSASTHLKRSHQSRSTHSRREATPLQSSSQSTQPVETERSRHPRKSRRHKHRHDENASPPAKKHKPSHH
ncbi:hypothetical protein AB1N83_010705 [Pleurotus pulmonarius]